jgi:hypothetical protein
MTLEQPFVKVYENIDGDKQQLYLRANDWMVSMFNDAESVVQYSDKEEGVIIGRYLFHGGINSGFYGMSVDYRIFAKINITLKDGRARIEITPEQWRYDSSGMSVYDLSYEDAIAKMESISESFNKALQSKEIDF